MHHNFTCILDPGFYLVVTPGTGSVVIGFSGVWRIPFQDRHMSRSNCFCLSV